VIAVDYKEDANKIVVTTLCKRKPITRTITDKATQVTTIEVYKEGSKEPIERYVYTKV
jgi:hypothetical protein